MERELARLAEEACDDVAVSEIEDREEYAATLVDIAHAAAADGGVLNWRIISMAKDSNVARRVNRILEASMRASKPFGRVACVMLFACGLPVIYLSAAVKLLDHASVPASPVETVRQPILEAPKSSVRLIAQASPNQPRSPAPQAPPITMCIVIDNSGNMRTKREGVKAAALALMRASKPGDEVCLVDFNDETYLDLDFTGDITEMEEALLHIEARGGKAMRDAVRMSLDQVRQAAHNDRKVIVLVTEGNDSASSVSQEQLLSEVRNSGVRVYTIGLVGEDDPPRAGAARLALGQLAEASGGMAWYPRDLAEVESISPQIAAEVRKQ